MSRMRILLLMRDCDRDGINFSLMVYKRVSN
jgi:hypothetical protein